jgi:hypothetical protein
MISNRSCIIGIVSLIGIAFQYVDTATAFTISSQSSNQRDLTAILKRNDERNTFGATTRRNLLQQLKYNHLHMTQISSDNSLQKVPEDDETAIPFLEGDNSSFIECYADSKAIVSGVEYTIGSPCDNAVALCYFDDQEQLVPIELDEELMDDIFNLAAR